jgi:integrase
MPREQPDLTVREVIDHYLALGMEEISERTREHRRRELALFVAMFGDRRLSECRMLDMAAFIEAHRPGWGECTIRRTIAGVKRCFNWACYMDIIPINPFARFRSKGRLPNHREPMSDAVFQTLLRYAPPAWRRFLIFLKFTGCRPGEAASMTWGDVRFEESCVILEDHKTARKTGKPRIIPLVPTVLKMLLWMRIRRQTSVAWLLVRLLRAGPLKSVEVSRYLSHYGVSDRAIAKARQALGIIKRWVDRPRGQGWYTLELPPNFEPPEDPSDQNHVFLSCLGSPLNHYSCACFMRRVRARAGLPKSVILYSLRHRFFMTGIKNDTPLKLLSLAGGHASVATTEIYLTDAGLGEDVKRATLQAVYGPNAYIVQEPPPPRPVPSIPTPPPVEQIPRTTEHLPTQYGIGRKRPNIPAALANVPLPNPAGDVGQQSLESLLRQMMTIVSAQKRAWTPKPTSSTETINHWADEAYKALAWAKERNPALADAKDGEIYKWLKGQADCPHRIPPILPTFRRYLSAARLFYGTRKRIMPPRPE